MTPAERELSHRLNVARKDLLHHTATIVRLIADERYGEVVRMAEVLGDRATDAMVIGDAKSGHNPD